METSAAIESLGALAQENRLGIFRTLVQAGPPGIPAGSIADQLGLPANTLSFHVRRLEQAGLITAKRKGRQIIYSANFDAMNTLLGFLTENCCGGAACPPAAPTKE